MTTAKDKVASTTKEGASTTKEKMTSAKDSVAPEAKERFMREPSSIEESKVQSTAAESHIPVIEEKLEASKKETVEEAKVIKEPIKETKTVEVQLTHEELIIKKRPVDSKTSSLSYEEIVQSKTEISIPLKREDVIVSKKPYVKEEVSVKKKPVTETKIVTEEITSERVSVRNSAGEIVKEEEKEEAE